jgi:sulfur carrier protein ThiS
VKVTILPARELREVDAGDVGQLLKELKLHQDAYLVIRSDEILTRDVKLKSSDEVEIWPVISGGRR